MNTISKILFFIFFVTIMFGCKKDKDDKPVSFVDDYDPPLTETKGVEYTGDYFPIDENYYWYWEGTESAEGEINMTYRGENMNEPIDECMDVYATTRIQSPESITLETGTYTLYPAREADYSIRYYEKVADAIYLRAIQQAGSETILEIKNPVFIKNPLIVGDKWEAQPQVDLEKMIQEEDLGMGSGDIEAKLNCVIYVIGKENINWDGNLVQTVRLDERAEANAIMNIDTSDITGTFDINIKMTLYLNLLEDVGIIQQKSEISMIMNGDFSFLGGKIIMKVDMDTEGLYTLSTYDLSGNYKSAVVEKIADKDKLADVISNYIDNTTIQNQIIKGFRVAELIQKSAF